MQWQLIFRLSDRECAFNKATMQNSNQGGFVCAAMLDAFGLFAQVLRVLCSHNIHFLKVLVSDTKQKTLTLSSAVKIHCHCQQIWRL